MLNYRVDIWCGGKSGSSYDRKGGGMQRTERGVSDSTRGRGGRGEPVGGGSATVRPEGMKDVSVVMGNVMVSSPSSLGVAVTDMARGRRV